MAPLNPNFTDRWFLDYESSQGKHTMLMRTEPAADAPGVSDAFEVFLQALDPLLSQITVTGLRHSNAGSNITNPETYTGQVTFGSGSQSAINSPAFLSFVGRDVSGHRARVYVYGIVGVSDTSYRITPTENAAIGTALSALRETGFDFWKSINALPPTWHEYANTGFNAYWQRQRRVS